MKQILATLASISFSIPSKSKMRISGNLILGILRSLELKAKNHLMTPASHISIVSRKTELMNHLLGSA